MLGNKEDKGAREAKLEARANTFHLLLLYYNYYYNIIVVVVVCHADTAHTRRSEDSP